MRTIITGQPERIYVEYRDSDHVLVDPLRPRVSVFAPSGSVVVNSAVPNQELTGIYYYTLSLTTAYATERGVYQVWWEGFINDAAVYMDEPLLYNVIDIPITPGNTTANDFITEIRVAIGDNREEEQIITPRDMNYFVMAGVRNANSSYNMGYEVFMSTAGNDRTGRIAFYKDGVSTSLSWTAKAWYHLNIVRDIMETQARINMYGPGIINAGDIKVNLAFGLREQTNYLESLNKRIKNMETELKLNGGVLSGYWVNNYAIADLWVSEY